MLNDKISLEDVESKTKWRKYFRDIMPVGKRFRSYHAVKLGRLAVNNNFKERGIGTTILDYIKELFVNNNRTGCKYLTIDAYKQSLSFYERNGFNYLTEQDIEADTRLYFDLAKVK
jgi:predicted GNAT family N-acyltransferase